MLDEKDISLPKGKMIKITKPVREYYNDINFRGAGDAIVAIKILDHEYLKEIIDKPLRMWSLVRGTVGGEGFRWKEIVEGSFAMYLGSLNVYSPLTNKDLQIFRVVLLGKEVYAVPKDSVEWC